MDFNKDYTDYWADRVNKSTDGTKIADIDIADFFLSKLTFKRTDKILDMGCSFGRFYPLLSKYCDNVSGIDIEASAVERASAFGYTELKVGPLESMPFDNESFDKAYCWAVLDCTEQDKVLIETNRILKKNGVFIVTGKNNNYHEGDMVAFVAERNARLKSFPNRFTDLPFLFSNPHIFGFKIIQGFGFEKRGDFGLAKAFNLDADTVQKPFYEYLLIMEKTNDIKNTVPVIWDKFSETAKKLFKSSGFDDIDAFFKNHFENDKT